MMIDKIGGMTPLNNVQKTRRTEEASRVDLGHDSISVSAEAKEMAEAYYLKQVAAETPNVRADRVAEVKAKIKDPSYLSDAILASTADRILDSYGI